MFAKKKRIKNRALLDYIKSFPCEVCGRGDCDPAHLKTVGSGGDDTLSNVISQCRRCHAEQGVIGIQTWFKKYGERINNERRFRGWPKICPPKCDN